MRDKYLNFADICHLWLCRVCLILFLILLGAELSVVLLRYIFGIGFLELQGVVSYSFAVLVILSLPIALRFDRHVRVDIFRDKQSKHIARWFDRLGIICLLIPFMILVLYHFKADLFYSWSILEGSPETGGLAGYFIIKTALPLSSIFMLIQGVAILFGRYLRPNSSADGEIYEQ